MLAVSSTETVDISITLLVAVSADGAIGAGRTVPEIVGGGGKLEEAWLL